MRIACMCVCVCVFVLLLTQKIKNQSINGSNLEKSFYVHTPIHLSTYAHTHTSQHNLHKKIFNKFLYNASDLHTLLQNFHINTLGFKHL